MKSKIQCLVYTSFLFLTISISYGQDTLITYFDSDWEKLDSKEGAEFLRKSFDANGKRAFLDYYINGNLQSTGFYQTAKEEVEEGAFTFYSEDGDMTKIINYKNGEKNGHYTRFFTDKQIKFEGDYLDNEKDGTWKWYHKNGRPCAVEEYKKGEMQSAVYYDESGSELEDMKPIINPTYGGSNEVLLAYIEENFTYPEEARANNIEGMVVLKFTIDEEGFITKQEVERSVHPLLDNEALRILSTMKRWTPGKAHNQNATFEYQLPINFELTD